MKNDNSRNTVLFIVCTVAILILYQIFVLQPAAVQRRAQAEAAGAAAGSTAGGASIAEQTEAARGGATTPDSVVFVEDRRQALGQGARVPIQSPTLTGSMSLMGGRIDDLFLTRYRETLEAGSPPVELFRPQGMEHAYFAQFGWVGQNVPGGVPGPNTPWRLTGGTTLAPNQPITLTWDNGQGLRFTRTVALDDQYMFTVTDAVANFGTTPVTLAPYGSVQRQGVPDTLGRQMILHEGAIGFLDDRLRMEKYKDWEKEPRMEFDSTGGWLGITDKYWMAALIPPTDERVEAEFRVRDANGLNLHEANILGQTRTVAPGATVTEVQRLFAGAKRAEILKGYERSLGVPKFDLAIDWGMFWFLTRPIFMIVEFFYGVVGNFGVAILLLTVVVKLLLFPLANKAYESMSKMKTLQPKMEEIKKRYPDDPAKQQQETLALYKNEKINPLAGCLPILVQIPVFYALYKVLFVTIEMRHAPFFGWIRDLSAPDPTNIFTLFGLIPWDPATVPLIGGFLVNSGGGFTLALSVLAIVYGATMWLQQAMNPPPPDPVQRKIFAILPLIFTFIFVPFAAGLLIYWTWNNVLSILQQYVIMHRFKADNPIDSFIARLRKTGS